MKVCRRTAEREPTSAREREQLQEMRAVMERRFGRVEVKQDEAAE